MKNIKMLLAAMVVAAGTAAAQQAPNRVFIHDTDGVTKGYVADRVDKITFDAVDGEVAADVTISKVENTELTLTVKRTAACNGFRIAIVPESMAASQLSSDLAMIRYIEMAGSEVLTEDFIDGKMSGFEPLSPGSSYRVATVGIDKFGIPCEVRQARFQTKNPDVVGDPDVDVTLKGKTLTTFTVDFKPNSDVSEYYYMSGEKGTVEAQYDMFAAMFGYNNINEMIAGWGISTKGASSYTWEGMNPNTEYDVFVAMKDRNGNFAPHKKVVATTECQGGEGTAEVDVKVTDYCLSYWDSEELPTLEVAFTPNDQTWCYRFGVYLKSEYEKYNDESWRDEICRDPDMPMARWFFYEPLTTDFQVNPKTDIVILAAAKNAKGEWGPMTVLNYTTPDKVDEDEPVMQTGKGAIQSRIQPNRISKMREGQMPALPALNTEKGIRLSR